MIQNLKSMILSGILSSHEKRAKHQVATIFPMASSAKYWVASILARTV